MRTQFITDERDTTAKHFLRGLQLQHDAAETQRATGQQPQQPTFKSLADFARIFSFDHGGAPQPVPRPTDVAELLRIGQSLTPGRAIGTIASTVASRPVIIEQTTSRRTNATPVSSMNPLRRLVDKPNPSEHFDLCLMLEEVTAALLATGDAYLWKIRNTSGVPIDIWPLNSAFVRPIAGHDEFIQSYRVDGVFAKETTLPAADVIHVRACNLDWTGNRRYYGSSQLAESWPRPHLEQHILERLAHEFVTYSPPGLQYSTDGELTGEQLREIYEQVYAQHSVASSTGAPIIAHSGFRVQEFKSKEKLSYLESLKEIREAILLHFGVPRSALGGLFDHNRASAEASLQSFAEHTVNPLLRRISAALNSQLAVDFGPDITIRFEPLIMKSEVEWRADIESAAKIGAITPNEMRALLLDLPPYPSGGDIALTPGSLQPAGLGHDKQAAEQAAVRQAEKREGEEISEDVTSFIAERRRTLLSALNSSNGNGNGHAA